MDNAPCIVCGETEHEGHCMNPYCMNYHPAWKFRIESLSPCGYWAAEYVASDGSEIFNSLPDALSIARQLSASPSEDWTAVAYRIVEFDSTAANAEHEKHSAIYHDVTTEDN